MNKKVTQDKLFIQNKKCSKCHIEKDINEFSHDAGRKDGYSYWCKQCMNLYTRTHYKNNKEHKAEKAREYRNKNKEQINAYIRKYRAEKKLNAIKNGNPTLQQKYYQKTKQEKHDHYEARKEIIRDRNMFRKYGITIEQRNKMIAEQNNCCAICKETLEDSRFTHIDHDHNTQRVRGILCSKCNAGIGMFNESVVRLQGAIKYLEG